MLLCMSLAAGEKMGWSHPSPVSCQDRPQQASGLVGGVLSQERRADVPPDLSKACVTLLLFSGILQFFLRPFSTRCLMCCRQQTGWEEESH